MGCAWRRHSGWEASDLSFHAALLVRKHVRREVVVVVVVVPVPPPPRAASPAATGRVEGASAQAVIGWRGTNGLRDFMGVSDGLGRQAAALGRPRRSGRREGAGWAGCGTERCAGNAGPRWPNPHGVHTMAPAPAHRAVAHPMVAVPALTSSDTLPWPPSVKAASPQSLALKRPKDTPALPVSEKPWPSATRAVPAGSRVCAWPPGCTVEPSEAVVSLCRRPRCAQADAQAGARALRRKNGSAHTMSPRCCCPMEASQQPGFPCACALSTRLP